MAQMKFDVRRSLEWVSDTDDGTMVTAASFRISLSNDRKGSEGRESWIYFCLRFS